MAEADREGQVQRPEGVEAPGAATRPGGQTAMAAALGNQAFGSLIGVTKEAAPPRSGGLSAAGDHVVAAQLARAVLARDNGHEEGAGTAVAEPPQTGPASAQGSTWVAPLELGEATTRQSAALLCAMLAVEAAEMREKGFDEEFVMLQDEASARRDQFRDDPAPLSAGDVRELTAFGNEFRQAHRLAISSIANRIAGQFSQWQNPGLTEDELFELRETVHDAFIASDEGRLGQLTEFLEKLEDITGRVDDWVGYGRNAASLVRRAQRLSQISEAVDGIHSRVESVQEIVTLARDIGRLSGQLGDGPAGVDDITRVEGGLGALDFVVGRLEVPGISQLWGGYILPAAQASLRGLRHVMNTLYRSERGSEILHFFQENRRRATAPDIRSSLARYGNLDRHFPGGQRVLNFMWRVMRDEATSVPDDVEDYFVRYRDEFNAGMGRGNQIETDSSIGNLWNIFTREESDNLLQWVLDNRREVWTRLYGGMPAPQGS